jgi:hypothetical protein
MDCKVVRLASDVIVSSCVRSGELLSTLQHHQVLLASRLSEPAPGHLVLCEVEDAAGVYASIEVGPEGAAWPLTAGARFVGVLGNRLSCTNVSGRVPGRVLTIGSPLSVLSKSGIVGELDYVPPYLGMKVPEVCFAGVLCRADGKPMTCGDFPKFSKSRLRSTEFRAQIVVCGSSAESGKTTLVSGLIRNASRQGRRVGALKLCGTGRIADIAKYREAGAHFVGDFVDVGEATTYGLEGSRLDSLLEQLECAAEESGADTLFYELGGDIEEDAAKHFLMRLASAKRVIFVANSSLAARAGVQQLRDAGARQLEVASLFQNVRVLERRAEIGRVYDIGAPEDLRKLWKSSAGV